MTDPHHNQPLITDGRDLTRASEAIILLHGRGGSADSILQLGIELADEDTALLAPQAAGFSWYPNSFLAPLNKNEPWLTSALRSVSSALDVCLDAGLAFNQISIAGFSQGACLATEFVARHPAPYRALLAFTGGLIGPLEMDLRHDGSLEGCAAFFSSGDPDPHVPFTRVEESADEVRRMGATVTLHRHPGRPHTVLNDEIIKARKLIRLRKLMTAF